MSENAQKIEFEVPNLKLANCLIYSKQIRHFDFMTIQKQFSEHFRFGKLCNDLTIKTPLFSI